MSLSQQLSQPTMEDLGTPQELAPLLPGDEAPTLARWEQEREKLRQRWLEHLGQPAFGIVFGTVDDIVADPAEGVQGPHGPALVPG